MPQLALQPSSENGHVWVTLDGQRVISLRDGDAEGLRAITTWLVEGKVITAEEAAAAAVQGVTVRTVEAYRAAYAETGNSSDLG